MYNFFRKRKKKRHTKGWKGYTIFQISGPRLVPLHNWQKFKKKKKEKKKLSCMDCQSPTPNSQNSLLLVNRSADCEFQSSKQLMSCHLRKSELAVLVLGYEKVGVGTWQPWADNQRTTYIVASIVYAWSTHRGSSKKDDVCWLKNHVNSTSRQNTHQFRHDRRAPSRCHQSCKCPGEGDGGACRWGGQVERRSRGRRAGSCPRRGWWWSPSTTYGIFSETSSMLSPFHPEMGTKATESGL